MIRILPFLLALSLSFSLTMSAAFARDLTAADQAALQSRIASFSQAFQAGDMAAVSSVVPPKIISAMAEKFGMEPAQLIAAMDTAMTQAMQSVELVSYRMDVDAATTSETSSGRVYVLIPTATDMIVDGETRIAATSQTLAFADAGTWYLVRIDDAQQIQFLTLAYPEFKGISFPKGSMKIIED